MRSMLSDEKNLRPIPISSQQIAPVFLFSTIFPLSPLTSIVAFTSRITST